jgi:hypothetical protein
MIFSPTLTKPIDLAVKVRPDAVGMTSEGVRRIEQVFDEQIACGLHPGAQPVM